MALVVSDLGECELLDKMLKDALTTDENYTLKLFKNDYTPIAASVAADFTEADFGGYAAKTLTRAGWNAATTVSNQAQSTYSSSQVWTCSGTGNTVYGYYVVGATSGVMLWAERFSTSRTLANGDSLTITPTISLNSAN